MLVHYMTDMYDKNISILRRNASKDDKFPKNCVFLTLIYVV